MWKLYEIQTSVPTNKVSLEQSLPIYLHIVYDWFPTMAEITWLTMLKISSIWPFTESLLSPDLKCNNEFGLKKSSFVVVALFPKVHKDFYKKIKCAKFPTYFLQYAASWTRIANPGQQGLHFLVAPITGLQGLAHASPSQHHCQHL